MSQDGRIQRPGPSIMEEAHPAPEPPQGCGPPIPTLRLALGETIVEVGPEIVEQQVRVKP